MNGAIKNQSIHDEIKTIEECHNYMYSQEEKERPVNADGNTPTARSELDRLGADVFFRISRWHDMCFLGSIGRKGRSIRRSFQSLALWLR